MAAKAPKTVIIKAKVPYNWDRNNVRRWINESHDLVLCEAVEMPRKQGTAGQKGRSWERDFSAMLSLWWTQNADEHVFGPRSGSGGARRDKAGWSSASGDIHADQLAGDILIQRYSFECKFYKDLSVELWKTITGEHSRQLSEFWEQALSSALPYARFVIMPLKMNNRKPVVITNHAELAQAVGLAGRVTIGDELAYMFALDDLFVLDPLAVVDLPGDAPKKQPRFKRRR